MFVEASEIQFHIRFKISNFKCISDALYQQSFSFNVQVRIYAASGHCLNFPTVYWVPEYNLGRSVESVRKRNFLSSYRWLLVRRHQHPPHYNFLSGSYTEQYAPSSTSSFSTLNNPRSFSHSSSDLFSRPFLSLVVLLWTHSSTSMSFLQ